MPCALPPFEPPEGVPQRRLALAVVGGARSCGDRHLSAIARLQGFSSCSLAAFPHQWAVWWGEASHPGFKEPGCIPPRPQLQGFSSSGLRRRSAPSGGLPLCGPVTLFFPQCFGEKGILQPCRGFLQPCGGRRTAASWTGCNFPSFVRAAVVPRTGQPRPGLPRVVSRSRGLPSTSYAARAVLVFWGGLGEDGSEDLSVRFRSGRRTLVRRW
jgi:hypothetical protein